MLCFNRQAFAARSIAFGRQIGDAVLPMVVVCGQHQMAVWAGGTSGEWCLESVRSVTESGDEEIDAVFVSPNNQASKYYVLHA